MTTLSWFLALLAAAAAIAASPSMAAARLRALDTAAGRQTSRSLPSTMPIRGGTGLLALGGGATFGAVAQGASGARLPVLPVLAGLLAGSAVGLVVSGSARDRDRRRHGAALVESVGALAADLRAGQQPADALAALPPGSAPQLQSPAVAAVWTVSERSGAPAAAVLDRVEQDLRARERQRREVTAQLAGARSTAGLLAMLPLLGIGLGTAMGAEPVHVLFGTGRGHVALLVGAGLEVLGLLWTARIVASAGGAQ